MSDFGSSGGEEDDATKQWLSLGATGIHRANSTRNEDHTRYVETSSQFQIPYRRHLR